MVSFNIKALTEDSPFYALPALDYAFAEFQAAPEVYAAAASAVARTQVAAAPVFANAAALSQSQVKSGTESPSRSKLSGSDSSDGEVNSKIASATYKGPTNTPSFTATPAPIPSTTSSASTANTPPVKIKKAKPEATVKKVSNEELAKKVLEHFPLPVVKVVIPGKGILGLSTSKNEFSSCLTTVVADTTKILRNFLSKNNQSLSRKKEKEIKRKKEILLKVVDEVYAQVKKQVPDVEKPSDTAINEKIDLELSDGKEVAPSDVRRAHRRKSTAIENIDPKDLLTPRG
jgi:hypothetical protein